MRADSIRARDEEQMAAVDDLETSIGNQPLQQTGVGEGTRGSSAPAMISVGGRSIHSHGRLVQPNAAAS